MPVPRQRKPSQCPVCAAPLPEPELIHVEPAEVFEYWYNRFRAEFPALRPPLKWLAAHSRLARSTCGDYRRRMEDAFPDAYGAARVGKKLKLGRALRPRGRSEARGESEFGILPSGPPCVLSGPVQ